MLAAVYVLLLVPWTLGAGLPVIEGNEQRSIAGGFETIVHSDEASGICKSILVKIIFPAAPGSREVDSSQSPYPVVIFFGGAQTESNRYQWLGEKLVRKLGVIYVTTESVGFLGGSPMLLPIDGGRTKPTSPNPAMLKLFEKLKQMNDYGRYAGHLNLKKVVVGGHSYGGRFALVDAADSRFFPNVVGAFLYAAHAYVYPTPGFIPGSVMTLEGTTPLLLMAGSKDIRLQGSGPQLYTTFTSPAEPVWRTFNESFAEGRLRYYIEFDGFNHMSPVSPQDRSMLGSDGVSTFSKKTTKAELFRVISFFVQSRIFGDNGAVEKLEEYMFKKDNPYIKDSARKGSLSIGEDKS